MVYLLRVGWIVLCTVFWGLISLPIMVVDRSGEGVIFCGRRWIQWILWGCRIRLQISGLENVDPSRSYVFMPNHQSALDVAAIILAIPVSFRFVAKKEILRVPFVGWAAVGGGHIIVDRGDNEQAVASLQRAIDRIRGRTNVILYPEGTRSVSGRLRTFKSGGFHLAIEAGVPIIPVSVSGSHKLTPRRSLRVRSGNLRIVFGKPIETAHLTLRQRHELKETVRSAILEGFDLELQGADVVEGRRSDH